MTDGTGMRGRIAYLQHVDWRWIRQRPQFLAEQLGACHDVRVFFRVHPHRRRFPRHEATMVGTTPLLPLPTGLARPWEAPAAALQRAWLTLRAGAARPDLCWLTFPSLLGSVPRAWRDVPLVYDCMDDALGFAGAPRRRARLEALEGETVRRAALVLCSSEHLRETLRERWADVPRERFALVRNGLASHLVERFERGPAEAAEPRAKPAGAAVRLAYIGTIADWLDTDLLVRALDEVPELSVDLYGPSEAARVSHDRLRYMGILPHDRLAATAATFDGLIMPFRLTPLIRSVDPVKLYEYLSFGRPVLSIGYEEVARFGPYVHLYEDPGAFVALVRALRDGTLPPRSAASDILTFLRRNTWTERAREVTAAIEPLMPRLAPRRAGPPARPLETLTDAAT